MKHSRIDSAAASRRIAAVLPVVLLVLLLALAACGGDDDDQAEGSRTTASSDSGGGGVAEAEALVQEAMQPVSWDGPTDPIPGIEELQGKTVWFLRVISTPFVVEVDAGAKEAAELLGMNYVSFDGKGSVSEWNKGLQNAVGQGADGIILQGIDPTLVEGPLNEAIEAGIPVVDSDTTDPDQPTFPGIFAHVTTDFTSYGRLLAANAIAETKEDTNAVIFIDPKFEIARNLEEGFVSEIESRCPECQHQVRDFDSGTLAQVVPSAVSNLLRTDPEINWVLGSFDFQVTYLLDGIRAAGRVPGEEDVRVGAGDAVDANLDFIRNGEGQVVDIGGPNEWKGWAEIDQLARAMLGLDAVEENVPRRLFTAENLPPANAELYGDVDFREEYRSLWGL